MIQWFFPTTSRLALIGLVLFLVFSTLTRLVLLGMAAGDLSWHASLAGAVGWGVVFDLASGLLAALPWLVLGLVMPQRFWRTRAGRWFCLLLVCVNVLVLSWIGVAECVFWEEFGVRFNFIAVDYLVFTQEGLGNIFESYPMGLIITGMVTAGVGVAGLLQRTGVIHWVLAGGSHPRHTAAVALAHCGLAALTLGFLKQDALPAFDNQFNAELAKNGAWSFMAACRSMELDYERFYVSMPPAEARQRVRHLLASGTEGPGPAADDDLSRVTRGTAAEHRWNVISICMESMSGNYTRHQGSTLNLTPCLDQLANEGLNFKNLYATGTRTVRGMEALTLSLPPTPGQSILYRPEGKDLRTSFSDFLERGYDCAFIYGGHGQFDYMNRYYSSAGCRLVDLGAWQPGDVTCAAVWGACDGDLFRKTIAEADADHAAGKPFHFFCMTTSNHRPYVFPDGCIDMPSGSGRLAAVKYSDWAVGQLVEAARTKPWFKNTLFVFCADHCASSAGKAELDVTKYQIPAFLYNPHLVPAGTIDVQCSQIDLMPTVFGLLNWPRRTVGFGHDLLAASDADFPGRAFVSNYQKIGLLEGSHLAILKPTKRASTYDCDLATGAVTPLGGAAGDELTADAVSYYQCASWLFKTGRLKQAYAAKHLPLPTKPTEFGLSQGS